MRVPFVESCALPECHLWNKMEGERILVSFQLELTARCNNNCRHCYINLDAQDKEARKKELSFANIKKITNQAVSLGALWCLITGGEPLLREDFFDIYLYLKKKGLLVSVFTNATLLNLKHIQLFKKYPPRDIEVTVYGVTKRVYERVTRASGSFNAFMRGLNLLLRNNIKVRFKTMALRSNLHQLPEIAQFCRKRTKDFFRFDPFLTFRFDANKLRNEEIKSERLSPKEIAAVEKRDRARFKALENRCDKLTIPQSQQNSSGYLFACGAGEGSFSVGYDGFFRLCSSLINETCVYDLKKGTLSEAWQDFVPRVRNLRSNRKEFLRQCRSCPLINLCMWCPAHSYLETGRLDTPVEYFCETARARAKSLTKGKKI